MRHGALFLFFLVGTHAFAEIPPVGRSMLDYLLHLNGDRIPETVTDFIRLLEDRGQTKVSRVLIPDGRSSQRIAAGDAHPRIVGAGQSLAHDGVRLAPQEQRLLQIRSDLLFFAYSELERSMEVISANPKAARFEFQTIENFGTASARVTYARRAFCTSCHVGGVPLFTPSPWGETDQTDAVAARIRRAVGGTHYQRQRIGHGGAVTLTEQVQLAAQLVPLYDAWRALASLRPFFLETVLLGATPGDVGERFAEALGDHWPEAGLVLDYRPLPDRTAVPRPTGAPPTPIPVDLLPGMYFKHHLRAVRTDEPSFRMVARSAIHRATQRYLPPDFRRSFGILTNAQRRELSTHPEFRTLLESDRAPDPYAFQRTLGTVLGKKMPARVLTDLDEEMPPPVAEQSRGCPTEFLHAS